MKRLIIATAFIISSCSTPQPDEPQIQIICIGNLMHILLETPRGIGLTHARTLDGQLVVCE